MFSVPVIFAKPAFLLLLLVIPPMALWINRWLLKSYPRRARFLLASSRCVLVCILSLTLSDPRILKRTDKVNILFCLDVSESMSPEGNQQSMDFIRAVSTTMQADDQAGLIVFGKEPSMEVSLSTDFHPHISGYHINKNYTNIYEALKLAVGKLPREGKNKIVLISDGNENIDQAVDMAYLAASLGVEIFPVAQHSPRTGSEVHVETLKSPKSVLLNTPFEVQLILMSTDYIEGELVLLRNDELVMNQSIQLRPGRNIIRFSDQVNAYGLFRYRAVLNCPEDYLFQNNEGVSYTRAIQPSIVLYLTGDHEEQRPLFQALKGQGIDVVSKTPKDVPLSIYDLVDYNAVVMDNVSGRRLSLAAMEIIERYVRDMGGGLIMIGGEESFGVGHYNKTPIEKALPVFMDIPTALQFSGVCMVLIIDKSSSMSATYASKSKLEMAKIAAFSTVELLNPIDSVGLLAFDSEHRWIVPIMRVKERHEIARRLSALKEEGGTNLFPALKEAFRVLKDIQATKKHMIILSDGHTEEAEFQPLVHAINKSGITVSTVAVGSGSAVDLLRNIAGWGGGRSYYTDDPSSIPRIFTDETKIVAKKLIVEETLQVTPGMRGEMLTGIAGTRLPPIYGHILTYPKPGAGVLYETQKGPLLVTGQYGLGRGVAFTSDLSGRWGKDWVMWEHFGQFASQMVKWVQKKAVRLKYNVEVKSDRGNGTFLVDVIDHENRFVNNIDLGIGVTFPNDLHQMISLKQIAPGRYMAGFSAGSPGDYYFNLMEKTKEGIQPSRMFGFGIPYTEEFEMRNVDYTFLDQLAAITEGKRLNIDEPPKTLFNSKSPGKSYGQHLWPYLTIVFLLFLLSDALIRKFFAVRND